jgi:hypothetical protein
MMSCFISDGTGPTPFQQRLLPLYLDIFLLYHRSKKVVSILNNVFVTIGL